MSNQVHSNQVQRYRYNKERLLTIQGNIGIVKDVNTTLDYQVIVKDEIGTGLVNTAGVYKVVNDSAVGLYHISVSALWLGSASVGLKRMFVKKNNEVTERGFDAIGATLESTTVVSVMIDLRLNDEFLINVSHNASQDIVILAAEQTNMVITLVN